jgi:hypothetical protein
MHARFKLDPEGKNWEECLDSGTKSYEANKVEVEKHLERFKDAEGELKAAEIMENWFPQIKADVFLSHSHKDEKLIIGLAGWLDMNFGIKSFIDSAVWVYSDELLKAIDEKYCKNAGGETYNYDKRNRSTSHVHMMLSTSLAEMIDRCECVIFVDTPNSFKPCEYFKEKGNTESPWIYSEIAMTRMIRQRSPKEHRPQRIMDSLSVSLESSKEAQQSALLISYPLNTFHLWPLSTKDLEDWESHENGKKNGAYALDWLYQRMRD